MRKHVNRKKQHELGSEMVRVFLHVDTHGIVYPSPTASRADSLIHQEQACNDNLGLYEM